MKSLTSAQDTQTASLAKMEELQLNSAHLPVPANVYQDLEGKIVKQHALIQHFLELNVKISVSQAITINPVLMEEK